MVCVEVMDGASIYNPSKVGILSSMRSRDVRRCRLGPAGLGFRPPGHRLCTNVWDRFLESIVVALPER
jgi:hypothetical protein